jgi:hypothetical protein
MVMRRLAGAAVLGALALQGCTTGPQDAKPLRTATPPAQTIALWFCALKPVSWVDNSNDGVFGVGDAIVYTASLSRQPSCKQAEQTIKFNGVEEVVQPPSQRPDGSRRYLANFQGTLQLEEGTLQLRGLQSFVLSAAQAAQADALKDGQASLQLLNVLPESSTFTVVGGGNTFAGLVGTASYAVQPQQQQPVGLRLTLYKQAAG